jgi:hypothetical protein
MNRSPKTVSAQYVTPLRPQDAALAKAETSKNED